MRRHDLSAVFKTTPEVLLMEQFPPNVPWSIRAASAGIAAKVEGKPEHFFHDFKTALCWVAVQLGVTVQ